MTMIGGGQDNSAQLLEFIMNMKAKKQAVEHTKALALLNTLKPGEALGTVPGALKAYKTATGIEGDPKRVLSEETMAHLLDQNDVHTIMGMNPEQLKGIAQNRIYNAATGTTGRQTQGSFEATGQEATSVAQTRAGLAASGAASLGQAPPAVRSKAGERMILGETGKTTAANEQTTVAGATEAQAKSEVTALQAGVVKDFFADPENSKWGQSLKQFGIDPVAATQAFANGQGSLMTGMLDFKQALATGAQQTQRTGMEIKGRLDEALNQGRINTATEFFKQTGVPVRTSLAIENAIETGGNPFAIKGLLKEDVQMYLKAKQLGMTGYIREQINKKNPKTELLNNILTNMDKFKADPKLSTAANTLAAQTMAEITTEGEMGVPRPNDPGEAQNAWDRQLQLNYNSYGMIGKDAKSFLGFDMLAADKVTSTAPIGLRANHPATAPGDSAKVKPPVVDPGTGDGTPMFQDPDAAKAIGQIIGWGNDSTLIKR